MVGGKSCIICIATQVGSTVRRMKSTTTFTFSVSGLNQSKMLGAIRIHLCPRRKSRSHNSRICVLDNSYFTEKHE